MVERIIVGPLHTNAYIYSISKKECILIDPGADVHLLRRKLDAINMRPRGIIFTHGYLDHTSAAAGIMQAFAEFSPDIPVGIHELDAHLLGTSGLEEQEAIFRDSGNSELFQELKSDLPDATYLYGDGDIIPETGSHIPRLRQQ